LMDLGPDERGGGGFGARNKIAAENVKNVQCQPYPVNDEVVPIIYILAGPNRTDWLPRRILFGRRAYSAVPIGPCDQNRL
jgi:hypothetical protein